MSNRIRVLWLVKGLSPGGAEKLLVWMARVGDHSRFDYEVAYVQAAHNKLVPKLAELDVPARCLNGGVEYDLRWARRLRQLLIEGRYDVVHVHSPYVAGVARLVVRTLPRHQRPALITTEHNMWSSYQWPTRLLNALTYGLDRHRFAVSSEVRRGIWPVYRRDVEVLVQGFVISDVPELGQTGAIRAELGLAPDEVLLVTVAHLRAAKDYPGLLRAVRMLLDDGYPVQLAAAGSGPLSSDIAALRDELGLAGKVHLLGHRDDIFALLRESDVYVMASRLEGYPIALMEAMVCGCAIVATAVGGAPDAVRTGIDGLLVRPGRPRELADSLAALVTNPDYRSALGRAAIERSTMFDISRPTTRTEEVYAAITQHGFG